jgi:RsmE family RNA methyltransferase
LRCTGQAEIVDYLLDSQPAMKLFLIVGSLRIVQEVIAWTMLPSQARRPYRNRSLIARSRFHIGVVCYLNRFLFDSSEIVTNASQQHEGKDAAPVVILPIDDYRTIHAARILSLENGDMIRSGVVSCSQHDGLMTDTATIQWIPEGNVKKAEPLRNGNPPGSLQVNLHGLHAPYSNDIHSKPSVSLILALPRPLQLGRMLPMISQMGVDTIVLTAAEKVPKGYFGSHLFRNPHILTEKLVEGLCQAGDVRLPTVHVTRNLINFLSRGELDAMFPPSQYSRLIAHPHRPGSVANRIRDSVQLDKVVIAVGPEGGWVEPGELELFQRHGFAQVTLGNRVLRSDCAVISLLSLCHDACGARLMEKR